MTLTDNTCTIWVCTDCLMVAANGELPDPEPECEPWSKLEGEFVTMGLVAEEHNEDCPNVDHETGEWLGIGDCTGCETQDFSWSNCEGCGSHLGGSRHAFTLWLED